MKLVIEIEMDNAAFEDDRDGEVKRLLRGVAVNLELDKFGEVRLRDINGNYVGFAKVVE